MVASYKFIQKFWLLHKSIKNKVSTESNVTTKDNELEIHQFVNQLINKITKNLENFHYNVIVANFHESYHFLNGMIKKPIGNKILLENYIKILKIMSPVIPHITSECLQELDEKTNISWPEVESKYLEKKNVQIVIQFNGKKRGLININKDITEKEIITKIKLMSIYEKYFNNSEIIKSIYVKERLINLIVK